MIGGKCGGIRAQIEQGKNGYLVNTPEECTKRVTKLVRDEPLKEEDGKQRQRDRSAVLPYPTASSRVSGLDRRNGIRGRARS